MSVGGVSHVSLVSMDSKLKDLIGGCCVCADERGWEENPLVYCDGPGCYVAVHQACYGITSVPVGPWYCTKCESQERSAKVRCELCPSRHGALKRTDANSWAHVVCALYIPEIRFANVSTMEPIVLGLVPADRYLKVCYLCKEQGQESRAAAGACMGCNKSGCRQMFHVTCAQKAGLLCEEAGNYTDNVKYCGYCDYHLQRINKKYVKVVTKYKPPDFNLIRVLLKEEDKGHKEPQNLAQASSSSSSSSSRKAKKGHRSSKSAASSSTSSPKLETGKSSTGSPSSTSSSAKRPHSEDRTAKTKSSKKDLVKKPTISTTSTADKTNDVSSTAEVSEKRPPSVIVKFGKQDGTYYSKKQELLPSSSRKKEKDIKSTDNIPNNRNKDSQPNTRSRSSSSSGSTEPSSDKPSEVQSNSKENSRGMNLPETSPTPTSTGVCNIDQNSESPSTTVTVEVDKKTDVKTELVEFDEDAALSTLKAPTSLPISAPERTMKTDIPNNLSGTISSSLMPIIPKLSVGPSSLSSSTVKIPAVSHAGMTPKIDAKLLSLTPVPKSRLEGTSQSNGPFQYHSGEISRPISPSRINTELISPNAAQKVAPTSKRTSPGKRLGRPPRKGTHMNSDSLGPMAVMQKQRGSANARKRKQSPQSRITNGSCTTWMMGATLNPSSSVAKEMDACLRDEIKTHAVFDPLSRNSFHLTPLPRKKKISHQSGSGNSSDGAAPPGRTFHPHTLEDLLERQWVQGSQFLMNNTTHFNIVLEVVVLFLYLVERAQ